MSLVEKPKGSKCDNLPSVKVYLLQDINKRKLSVRAGNE